MDSVRTVLAVAIGAAVLAAPARALANRERALAVATYRQAIAADPQDAAAYRGLASGLWLSITFRRGNMTVDDYLGKIGHSDIKVPPPPPEVSKAFLESVNAA